MPAEAGTVELKKSTTKLKEAVISMVATLNKHQRGEVWFGIKNDSTPLGQQLSEKTIKDIFKAIADNIEPKIFPIIEQVTVDAKQRIKVQTDGKNHPYYAYGRAYIRVCDEDRQLSARKLKSFLKLRRLNFGTIPHPLEKLNLLQGGKLLNADAIRFARNPEKFFPNARLRCAVFGTLDTTVTISKHEYYGDVFIC
jgi:ATP-dependent DNA helicase RecG